MLLEWGGGEIRTRITSDVHRTPFSAHAMAAYGRSLPVTNGRNRPILLKKSIMVSTAEKYASEIEIFTFGRGFQTQISRSSVQKWRSR